MDRKTDSLEQLTQVLRRFAAERDWEQYHSPKNLAMALIAESAELVEHFQWLTQEESLQLDIDRKQEVAHELADILIYLVRIADRLDIDVVAQSFEKIKLNSARFPADKVRGKHDYEEK